MDKEKISRINYLAKKKKSAGLTEAESEEQKELYREYIEAVRRDLKATLSNIEIIE